MYIAKVDIQNIRSIEKLEWNSPRGERFGWNVVLGDNGSGKTTFLRAVALALVGPKEAEAARQDWDAWLRFDQGVATVTLNIIRDPNFDSWERGKFDGDGDAFIAFANLIHGLGLMNIAPESKFTDGCFSAAYGPFRRFAGGDKDADALFRSNPKLGAHISVFGEDVALTETISWLKDLKYKELEHDPEGRLLNHLIHFVNQEGFLPHGTRLKEVSSRGVEFQDPNGFPVAVEELGDGYRSILSMTFELIRQMTRVYSQEQIFDKENERITAPGVVLIDEIDAHLHPSWQKKIGFRLTEHFPNIQFIVTTHSPLICQAAENGTIFRLPTPGTKEVGQMLEGTERDRLIYGDILDAYSTEAFGSGDTRSKKAHEMQDRLAALNVKELRQRLTAKERAEQRRLRAAFPTSEHVSR